MSTTFLRRVLPLVAALGAASVANAVPITFEIAGGSATTEGVTIGSTVSVTPSSTLAGRIYNLNEGESTEIFDFLHVTVTGNGVVGGLINSELDFIRPDATAEGVLGGFAVLLGWVSGGTLTVLNDPAPIAFGDGGWFDVDFFGFSDSCYNCSSLYGVVTAQISLLKAPRTSVPEPATLSLLGAGLLALGFSRRRKRAQA